jgi:polyvinyl alcohol dehydrogenase (cytochrome)
VIAQEDETGRAAFARACASCHEVVPYLKELPELRAIVRQGSGLMPAMAGSEISDAEILAVYEHLSRLGAGAPSSAATLRSAPSQNLAHPQGTNAGIYTFTERCAGCHDTGKDGAPDRYTLNRRTPEEVLASMTTGPMSPHAEGLSEFERRVTAVYIGGRPLGASATGDASRMKNRCESAPALDLSGGSSWNGWGVDAENSRFQTSPGLAATDVPKLGLKWAFGFPFGNSAYGQPTVTGGRVFVGADTGFLYSLDARTGCIHWSFRADAGVRTAISIGGGTGANRFLAYFGDVKGNVYAVDAETGSQVWKDHIDSHPVARVTGAPALVAGRLYVPLSSLEESGAGNPKYPCCTFRGGVVAYDALTGKRLWKSYTIPEAPVPLRKTSKGTQLWGPAGAGVWSSPTIDLKRRAVYVATGNGYTEPAVRTSDAVLAFDLDTGKALWTSQVMGNDAYVRDCPGKYRPQVPTENKSETCPDQLGPDMDFGQAPMLLTLPNGRDLLVVGQKDGHTWGLDPDRKGAIVWSRQIGLGFEGGGGGIMWGAASDRRRAYFAVTRTAKPLGLTAVDITTGEIAWRASPAEGGAAPVTVIPGVVFFGSSTGTLHAYSTADGKGLWQFDTAREFETVNGVAAKGGTMSSAGPVVAGGMVFVTSGYSDLGGGVRGNVLLAFGIP